MRILLVHGAWGRGATWDGVAERLTALGHRVEAPDLPGHGDDPAQPGSVGLDDYARAVAARLGAGPPAILVGHSMGGMVISAAAERAPASVRRLVYVCAFLPRDGDSLISLMDRQPGTIGVAVRRGPEKGTTVLDVAAAMPLLAQDAEPAAQAALAAALCPQPNRPQVEPAHLTADRFGRLPRAYILCEADRTITPALQHAMAAEGGCDPVLSLAAGHFPQVSHPDELARMIDTLARI